MKKLLTICLLLATVFDVNAQGTKPSKEETEDYILMMMNTVSVINENCEKCLPDKGIFWEYKSPNKNIYFKDCTLYFTVTARNDGISGETIYSKKIDFSKVEEVYQNQIHGINGSIVKGGEIVGCKLVEKIEGKSKIDYVNLYITDSQKMIKALNHLRKLCGAPEPINFDGN